LAEVGAVAQQTAAMAAGDFGGAVGGPVVHDEDLPVVLGDGRQVGEDTRESVFLVVGRKEDGGRNRRARHWQTVPGLSPPSAAPTTPAGRGTRRRWPPAPGRGRGLGAT